MVWLFDVWLLFSDPWWISTVLHYNVLIKFNYFREKVGEDVWLFNFWTIWPVGKIDGCPMHGEITLMRFSQWLLLCWAQLNLQLLIIGLSLHVSLGSMILTDKHFVHSPISTHDCSNGRTKPTVLLTALCSSQENTQFY